MLLDLGYVVVPGLERVTAGQVDAMVISHGPPITAPT
jgi:hypothetical protein